MKKVIAISLMLLIILLIASCNEKELNNNEDINKYNKDLEQEVMNIEEEILKEEVKVEGIKKVDGIKDEGLINEVNINEENSNEEDKLNNLELELLQVNIHLSTQNKNTNIQLPNICKIPEVHWSDNLVVEIKPIKNVKLSDALIKKLQSLYLRVECLEENNIIKMLVSLDDIPKFEIKNEDLNLVGYSLKEDVSIEHGYSRMKFNIIRYNKEHTQELLYPSGIVDDYLNLDIIFEEAQNQVAIEDALLDNLVGLESQKELPEVSFKWIDEYTLNMYITNINEKVDYFINFNGYVQPNGAIYYQVFSHSQVFGGLYGCGYGIYEFYRLPKQKIIELNINTLEKKQIGLIENYGFDIGPVWSELNKIILGTYDEWGYYTFIYDYVNNQFMSKDSLHTFDYEDIRKKDNYAYVLLQSHLMKMNMETSEVVSKVDNSTLNIRVLKYNENTNQLITLRYDYEKESYYLMLLDENLDIISEIAIKYEALAGMYSAYFELYWVDDERVAIAGKEKNTINTYIYNIKSGKRNEVIFNEKIVSISPNYEYMIFLDLKSNSLKARNSNYEIIVETTLHNDLEMPLYQYFDFWNNNNIYLDLDNINQMFIWDMESLTEKQIELPYERTAILEIVDEATIRLVTDAHNIEKSSFYGE